MVHAFIRVESLALVRKQAFVCVHIPAFVVFIEREHFGVWIVEVADQSGRPIVHLGFSLVYRLELETEVWVLLPRPSLLALITFQRVLSLLMVLSILFAVLSRVSAQTHQALLHTVALLRLHFVGFIL